MRNLWKYFFIAVVFSLVVPSPLLASADTSLDVDGLVTGISRKLLTKELALNGLVPQELYDVFQRGMITMQSILTERTPQQLPTLVRLQQKGAELHKTRALTSAWLMHLNLVCSELLSFEAETKQLSYITLGGASIDDGFNRFTYLHDHRQKLRPSVDEFLQRSDFEAKYTFGEGTDSFSLPYLAVSRDIEWVVLKDCFWLPILTNSPLFEVNTFNHAYSHRIGLVGIPFNPTGYDGFPTATPRRFTEHDIGHTRAFTSRDTKSKVVLIEFLDLSQDPWIEFWHQLWKATSKTPLNEFVVFDMFHETSGTGILYDYQSLQKPPELREVVARSLASREQYNSDFSSPETYWRSRLASKGITDVTSVAHLDGKSLEDTYTIRYRPSNSTEMLDFTEGGNTYDGTRTVIQGLIPFLRSLGAPIVPGIEEKPAEYGRACYAAIETAYTNFLNQHKGKVAVADATEKKEEAAVSK